MDAQIRSHHWTEAVAQLANRQHGVIARRQLAAVGVGRGAITRGLQRRLLLPLHRGVYASACISS